MSNNTTGPVWEPIAANVERLEVPGGWIYEIDSADDSTSTVFVPRPSDALENAAARIAAALQEIARIMDGR